MRSVQHRLWLLGVAGVAVCAFSLHAQTIVVQPYVQPGNGSTLAGADVKAIIWLTDQKPGEFRVEYEPVGGTARTAATERVALDFPLPRAKLAPADEEQHYFKYIATLTDLPFDTEVTYRVKLGERVVRASSFPTRATPANAIRFVMVGDLAMGKAPQNAIAWQISRAKPQFLVALGDIVYSSGRVWQYMERFWPTYNQPRTAGPTTGAPLMASVPFYAVLGNHDADAAKLPDPPDAYGAYHFFHPPLNGPGTGPWNTPLGKDAVAAAAFRRAVGNNYPALGFYSFDCGSAHFLVLDNNGYVGFDNPKLHKWIETDLRSTNARWKFVCCHAPAFHSSVEHYTEQKTRLLQPLFEKGGVDVVFAGHVHNYQRTRPLRFLPRPAGRMVNGTFAVDSVFDGAKNTQPNGVIHITAGGGGATLYRGDLKKNAAMLQNSYPGNWAPYTAKFVSDRHSFTVVDLAPDRLELRAIDEQGRELDRIVVTKPPATSTP